jgi:hypothetical protein
VGDPLRDGPGLSHRLFRLRPGVFQLGNYVGLPIFGSSVQISSSQMFGVGNLHSEAATKSGCHRFHPLRRPQHGYRNTLLGLDLRHHPRQYYFYNPGEFLSASAFIIF